MNHRAARPFPLEKKKQVPWGGVKAPDKLRDDPSHPHSSLGPDKLKSSFADGGVIGQVDSSEATGGFAHGGKLGAPSGVGHKRLLKGGKRIKPIKLLKGGKRIKPIKLLKGGKRIKPIRLLV